MRGRALPPLVPRHLRSRPSIADNAALGVSPTWLAGLILTLALPAALALSVLRSVWRARRPNRGV